MSTTITCPTCQTEIEITEAMSVQVASRIRAELEAELRPTKLSLEKQASDLKQQQEALGREHAQINETVRHRLNTERPKLVEEAKRKAAEEVAVELRDRDEQLNEAQAKLRLAQEQELGWRRRERDFREREESLARREEELTEELRAELAKERQQLEENARRKALDEHAAELAERDERLHEFEEKLTVARETELDLRRRERDLKDKAEELELSVTRRVDEEREEIRQAAMRRAAEEHAFKDAEKDKKITDLLARIDEMKRRAEQGSQQTQGEVLELALEDVLRQAFPGDRIEDVPKGIRGADVIQRVISAAGIDCGGILWETKRAKNWSDGWLMKLRQDQRDAKAHMAILVSEVLPEGAAHFTQIDGVWVCSFACAVQVACALRAGMLEVAKARRALEGQHTKTEQVYNYLSSPAFQNRVAGMIEAFIAMKDDLDAERRATLRQWAKREKQLEVAIGCTTGMYGDLQGIIGATLPELEGMKLLPAEPRRAELALTAE